VPELEQEVKQLKILNENNNENNNNIYNINNSHDLTSSPDSFSANSLIVHSTKKWKKSLKVPNLDLTKVSNEESEEEEDLDKMIENAIEMELEQNPDIANEFENIEDFKKYIFDK